MTEVTKDKDGRQAIGESQEARTKMKKLVIGVLLVAFALGMAACTKHSADVVSSNLSTEADQFHIARRIVFYNGITGEYMLTIQGLCSLGNNDPPRELSVTCKVGPNQYIKDFLGLSDNVTYVVEQTNPASVSTARYEVIFKPSTLVPDFSTNGTLPTPPSPSVSASPSR